MNIPQVEPRCISAGLTITFQRIFSAFSYDDGYTKAFYTINGTGGSKLITGTYSTGVWSFILTAANNNLTAGKYILFGWVETTDSSEKYKVFQGQLEVTASLTTSSATEQRSVLQQQLDNINTAITNYALNPVEQITIAGRGYQRPTLLALYRFRALTEKSLRTERKKENIRNGRPAGGSINVRFTNA